MSCVRAYIVAEIAASSEITLPEWGVGSPPYSPVRATPCSGRCGRRWRHLWAVTETRALVTSPSVARLRGTVCCARLGGRLRGRCPASAVHDTVGR